MNKTECIVVGAGPAGSACALKLAEYGIETVLLERGVKAGDKNVASAMVYTQVLEKLIPECHEEMPFERKTSGSMVLQLYPESFLSFENRYMKLKDSKWAYTVHRSRFDAWLAAKAENAGANLVTGMTVDKLLIDGKRICGVSVNGEELYADTVILADGVQSRLAHEAGLLPPLDPAITGLGVKEVLSLPEEVINERFCFNSGEGTTFHGAHCYPLSDIRGTFSLYLNKESVSLTVLAPVKKLKEKNVQLNDRLNMLKDHWHINRLIGGAELREYQAHLLPVGGAVPIHKLYGNGYLICGDAGGLVTSGGVGIPTAMLSGMHAAETVAEAKSKKDFSKKALSSYCRKMKHSGYGRRYRESRQANRLLYIDKRGLLGNVSKRINETVYHSQLKDSSYYPEYKFPVGRYLWRNLIRHFIPLFFSWPVALFMSIAELFSKTKVQNIKETAE